MGRLHVHQELKGELPLEAWPGEPLPAPQVTPAPLPFSQELMAEFQVITFLKSSQLSGVSTVGSLCKHGCKNHMHVYNINCIAN